MPTADLRAQMQNVQTPPAAAPRAQWRAQWRACPACTRTVARQQRAQTPGSPRTAPKHARRTTHTPAHQQHRCVEVVIVVPLVTLMRHFTLD